MGEGRLHPRRASAAEVAGALSLDALRCRADEMGPARWRQVSDAAQVVACYLVCHPRVGEVRYPGLKSDATFERAASTLRGGFGPLVGVRLVGEDGWLLWEADEREAREQVLDWEALL